jgi:hypothetical protein
MSDDISSEMNKYASKKFKLISSEKKFRTMWKIPKEWTTAVLMPMFKITKIV